MKNFVRLALAVSAFALTSQGSKSQAVDVPTIVRIDNWLNPSKYGSAASGDTISVGVRYVANGRLTTLTRVMDTISGSHDFVFNDGHLDVGDVYEIVISTNGTDLFIADQIELIEGAPTPIEFYEWGVDNEIGYCFSLQFEDGSNSHCLDGVANWSKTFRNPKYDPQGT